MRVCAGLDDRRGAWAETWLDVTQCKRRSGHAVWHPYLPVRIGSALMQTYADLCGIV